MTRTFVMGTRLAIQCNDCFDSETGDTRYFEVVEQRENELWLECERCKHSIALTHEPVERAEED